MAFATSMKVLAEAAIREAAGMNITLDYSEESIEQLEKLICAQEMLGLLPEDMAPSIDRYAAYLGEVFRQNLGGSWVDDKGGAAIRHQTVTVFPFAKVTKRIQNGRGDDLAAFYKVFRSRWSNGGSE